MPRCYPDLHLSFFFFFNDTATTEIYTLSLHDALPISSTSSSVTFSPGGRGTSVPRASTSAFHDLTHLTRAWNLSRSEEHTSELQSRPHLVCRLLLEKKKEKTERARTSTRVTLIDEQ